MSVAYARVWMDVWRDGRDACMHAGMYVCMYVCTYVYMSVCMDVCMFVCMYVCMYVCRCWLSHSCLTTSSLSTVTSLLWLLLELPSARPCGQGDCNITLPRRVRGLDFVVGFYRLTFSTSPLHVARTERVLHKATIARPTT